MNNRTFFAGAAVAAGLLASLALPNLARAQGPQTITVSTATTSSVTLANGQTLIVTAGDGSIPGGSITIDPPGIAVQGGSGIDNTTVQNAGSISGGGNGAVFYEGSGGNRTTGHHVMNLAGGRIISTGRGVFFSSGTDNEVTNAGLISGAFAGIEQEEGDNMVTNEAGGTITASSGSGRGAAGIVQGGGPGANNTVVNHGTILATNGGARGIRQWSSSGTAGNNRAVNTSTGRIVSAGYGIDQADGRGGGGISANGGRNFAQNDGTITTTGNSANGIFQTGGDNTIVNSGRISAGGLLGNGMVQFGARNLAVNDAGGTITAALGFGVRQENGDNTFVNAGTVSSVFAAARQSGNGNVTVNRRGGLLMTLGDAGVHQTGDANTAVNEAEAAVSATTIGISIEGADATLTNDGVIRAGQALADGNASGLGASGNDGIYVQGGRGVVVNRGEITAQDEGIHLVDNTSGGGNFRLTHSGVIDMFADGLAPQTLMDANGDKYDGDGILLEGGSGSEITIAAGGRIIARDGVRVLASGNTVMQGGTITARRDGVFVNGAAMLTNSGRVTAMRDGISLTGADGTMGSGLVVENAGMVMGERYGMYARGASARVTNTGSVAAGTYDGVRVEGDGAVVTSSGSVMAGRDGISLTGADGTMGSGLVVENAGMVMGGRHGMYARGASARVTNTGSVSGGTGDGVRVVGDDAVVTSSGTVSGRDGLSVAGNRAVIVNAGKIMAMRDGIAVAGAGGTIVNETSGEIQFGRFAFNLVGDNVLINRGSIIGGTAGGVGLRYSAGMQTLSLGAGSRTDTGVAWDGVQDRLVLSEVSRSGFFTVYDSDSIRGYDENGRPNAVTAGREPTRFEVEVAGAHMVSRNESDVAAMRPAATTVFRLGANAYHGSDDVYADLAEGVFAAVFPPLIKGVGGFSAGLLGVTAKTGTPVSKFAGLNQIGVGPKKTPQPPLSRGGKTAGFWASAFNGSRDLDAGEYDSAADHEYDGGVLGMHLNSGGAWDFGLFAGIGNSELSSAAGHNTDGSLFAVGGYAARSFGDVEASWKAALGLLDRDSAMALDWNLAPASGGGGRLDAAADYDATLFASEVGFASRRQWNARVGLRPSLRLGYVGGFEDTHAWSADVNGRRLRVAERNMHMFTGGVSLGVPVALGSAAGYGVSGGAVGGGYVTPFVGFSTRRLVGGEKVELSLGEGELSFRPGDSRVSGMRYGVAGEYRLASGAALFGRVERVGVSDGDVSRANVGVNVVW